MLPPPAAAAAEEEEEEEERNSFHEFERGQQPLTKIRVILRYRLSVVTLYTPSYCGFSTLITTGIFKCTAIAVLLRTDPATVTTWDDLHCSLLIAVRAPCYRLPNLECFHLATVMECETA